MNDEYPGNRVIEALGWRDGPNQIDRDLEGFWLSFLNYNQNTAEPALSALNEIVAERSFRSDQSDGRFGGMDPKSRVEIPWWVAWAISVGWSAYIVDGATATLGQAFGVEERGQGKHRFVATQKTRNLRFGYALEVAYELASTQPRPSVEVAVSTIAERFGVSEGTVSKAWKTHKSAAIKTVDTKR